MKLLLSIFTVLALCFTAQAQRVTIAFPSVAAMVAANPNNVSSNVIALGGSAAGDGNGGVFYYDKNSTATQGTNCYKPTNYGGRYIRLSFPGISNGSGSTNMTDSGTNVLMFGWLKADNGYFTNGITAGAAAVFPNAASLSVSGDGTFSTATVTNTFTAGTAALSSNILYTSSTVYLGAGNTNIVVDYAKGRWTLSQSVTTTTTNLFLTSIDNAPSSGTARGLIISILASGGNVNVYDVTSGATRLKAMTGTAFPVTITNGDIGMFSVYSLLTSNIVKYSYAH